MMEMITVKSSVISKIGYNAIHNQMAVEFNTGASYLYDDVSKDEYESIRDDQSMGSKLRRVMKDKEYRKV